ncbi:MAG: peptidylprolyl isomerase [Acidobacteriota bacterium]
MANSGVWVRFSSVLFIMLLLMGCGAPEEPAEPVESVEPEADEPQGTPVAVIEMDEGTVEFELLPHLAPETVQRFISLAELGFYNRTVFHRVIPGLIIQGGDPLSKDNNPYNDGQGGSGELLTAEFSDEPFARGIVAMARPPGDPNSASSQFFIVLKRMAQWDGEYTVFGKVIEGIEVVEAISNTPTSKRDPRLKEHPVGNIRIDRLRIDYR